MKRATRLGIEARLVITTMLICLTYVLIGLGVFARIASAEGQSAVVAITDGKLNLRTEPRKGDNVLAMLERGDGLTLEAVDANGWAEVTYVGDRCYCRAEYLLDELTTPFGATATVDSLRVREKPDTGSPTLCKLNKGEAVTVIGQLTLGETVWCKLQDGGWAMNQYLD